MYASQIVQKKTKIKTLASKHFLKFPTWKMKLFRKKNPLQDTLIKENLTSKIENYKNINNI